MVSLICRALRVCAFPARMIRGFRIGKGVRDLMRLVTFGEVMIRLAPEEFLRIAQVLPGRLEATFGGGEVNVAVSIALQGGQAAFATVLPDNVLTDAFVHELRKLKVDP